MSDKFQTERPDCPEPNDPNEYESDWDERRSRRSIIRPSRKFVPLPQYLQSRLNKDEKVTWVRGPNSNPWWEPVLVHPLLVGLALLFGVMLLVSGRLIVGTWAEVPPVVWVVALLIPIGSLFLVGLTNAHFTRLIVTNTRLFIVQGYEVCRTWNLNDLPRSLLCFDPRGQEQDKPMIDLDSIQTLLESSDRKSSSESIMAFRKRLDQITTQRKREE